MMSTVFPVLVLGRSWDWLRELCRPLGVQAQLVDQTQVPLLPVEAPSGAFSLHELLAQPERTLLAAVSSALHMRRPQQLSVSGFDVVCAPLTLGGRPCGVLVVARSVPTVTASPVSEQQLGTVTAWLAGAVESHLSSVPAGPDNLSALHKVLQHVVHGGTDRDLVAVFAEALALWHDIEVVGYIETAAGVFVRAAALAGRTAPGRPIVFPLQSLPAELEIARIRHADIDGLDAGAPGEVLVTTLSRGGRATWLLTMAGAIDACDPQVVRNYVSALDMAVALATAASRTRVAMLLSNRLSASPIGPGGFEAALEALREAIAATAATFSVESTSRRLVYHAGAGDARPSGGGPPERPGIVVHRASAGGQVATLGLVRADSRHFTPLEHGMALVAVELLTDWATKPALVEQGDTPPVFGRTMERRASEALERGLAVTAVVMSAAGAAPAASQMFVDDLRRQVRQSDLVGVLRPGEVGLLLPDTAGAHAAAVARRLRAALGTLVVPRSSVKTIGIATRVPGQAVADGILSDARANAQRQNENSRTPASTSAG